MKSWKSVLALAFTGVLVTTMAFAQGTAPSGSSSSTPKSDSSTSSSEKSGAMKSDTKSDMKSDMKSSKRAGGGNKEQVRAAQQALKDKGHDPGTIDGMLGAKTQAALKDFQKAEGLKETGRLDSETMAKLGVQAGAASASDKSSSPAASPSTSTSSPGSSSTGSSTSNKK